MLILEDASRWPRPFQWFGAIPRSELDEWSRRERVVLPSDLLELWEITGGGDVFEETIYRPTVPSQPSAGFVLDDIEGVNAYHSAKGNPNGLYIFTYGTFRSAVRLHDQRFVTISEGYVVKDSYRSLDEWYVNTLRKEFGERYGLDPILL